MKKSEFYSYLKVFLVGGIISHHILYPLIEGDFNDNWQNFRNYFKRDSNREQVITNQDDFSSIQNKVDRYTRSLFEEYYGDDASDKYKEYQDINNHANQLNPNNDAYWQSRGYDERPDNWEELIDNGEDDYTQDELDNHSDQLNPNNDAYWESRGYDERPDDWQDRSKDN